MDQQSFEPELTLIKSHLPSWKDVSLDTVKFEKLNGFTNQTYKVAASNSEANPSTIIYRKFGSNGRFVDRSQENKTFLELAKRKIAPICYGATEEYRLEEYFDTSMIDNKDLFTKEVKRSLAKWFAGLHKVEPEGIVDRTTWYLKAIEKSDILKRSIEKAKNEINSEGLSDTKKEWLKEVFSVITEEELVYLQGILPKDKKSIVFCHNDPARTNNLLKGKNGKPMFIDYEDGGYNYRGCEIGYFFNECMFDYSIPVHPYYGYDINRYPSDEDYRDFLRHYLFFYKFDWEKVDEEKALTDEEYFKQYIKENWNLEEFETEVEELMLEVKACTMLSLFYIMLLLQLFCPEGEGFWDRIQNLKVRVDLYLKHRKNYEESIKAKREGKKEAVITE